MPRTTKDIKKESLNEEKKVAKTTKKTSTSSKTTKNKTTKVDNSKKKATTQKKAAATTKSKPTPRTKKTTSSSAKKTSVKASSKVKKVEPDIVAEYYDLPYRYNETIVKILYQTPTVLFVYWDISDDDKNKFINQYGNNFFETTCPVLKVFNLTKNYDFEVPINDFANSWYIHVNDAGCDYKVELFRKHISEQDNNFNYVYVSSSNNIEFPNDHILIDELPNTLRFKNVKTNKITMKEIGSLRLIGISKIYNIHDFYKKMYKDEFLDEMTNKKLINPSSSSW